MNIIKNNFKKQLETERLILSPWQDNFAVDMYKNWATDTEVVKFLSWEVHENLEETKKVVSMWVEEQTYNWCIIDKDSKEAIGSISIVKNDVKNFNCEIGYCLSRKFWNKGIMTEALKKVLEFLFEEGYNTIYLKHAVENVASGRVMQKAGMSFVCTLPQATYLRGKFYDCNMYVMVNPNTQK